LLNKWACFSNDKEDFQTVPDLFICLCVSPQDRESSEWILGFLVRYDRSSLVKWNNSYYSLCPLWYRLAVQGTWAEGKGQRWGEGLCSSFSKVIQWTGTRTQKTHGKPSLFSKEESEQFLVTQILSWGWDVLKEADCASLYNIDHSSGDIVIAQLCTTAGINTKLLSMPPTLQILPRTLLPMCQPCWLHSQPCPHHIPWWHESLPHTLLYD
jgi:hypothetical protein